jgi:hypothetical protein
MSFEADILAYCFGYFLKKLGDFPPKNLVTLLPDTISDTSTGTVSGYTGMPLQGTG